MKTKKRWLLLAALIVLLLAAALLIWALMQRAGGSGEVPQVPDLPSGGSAAFDEPQEPAPTGGQEQALYLGRVVTGADDGSLLLAGMEENSLCRLTIPSELPVVDEQGALAVIEDGAVVQVNFSGEMLELYPSQPVGVTGITVLGQRDDLCGLYLRVLNDLWAEDEGLNSDITQLGVDLSATRLTQSEQAGVAWAFGEAHGIVPVTGTFEQLKEEGYITDSPGNIPYWKDGCLFTITESPGAPDEVRFDAQKWRSGLGADFWTDCTAARDAQGDWGDYQVGGWAIS